MANAGYIKLHRKIENWRYHPSVVGRKFTKYEAWIEFLKKANHPESRQYQSKSRPVLDFTGKPIEIFPVVQG